MSTTVTYKGTTLTTVTNETKTLETAGTWLEDDLELTDVSGSGGGVVVTTEPDIAGGTIVNIDAVDLSNDTVDASHLYNGYTAHDRAGNAITGTYLPPTYTDGDNLSYGTSV